LKVLFVTTEMDDFVRVGGLAAVSAALPRALRRWSDVRIMLPGYRDSSNNFAYQIVGRAPFCGDAGLFAGADAPGRLPAYVLLCPELTTAPAILAILRAGTGPTTMSAGRFARCAQLAAGAGQKLGSGPGSRHDWQAALVPAYLARNAVQIPSILTIHNLAYQGLFEGRCADRRPAPSTSMAWNSMTSCPPEGQRLCIASDHRQRNYAREIRRPNSLCLRPERQRSDAAQLSGF
jgi:starch synthase